MRIVVHDYVGYAFPAQLARALARRGHDVLFLHCSSFVAGKGRVERERRATRRRSPSTPSGSPGRSRSTTCGGGSPTSGRQAASSPAGSPPSVADVVLSSNAPLIVQRALLQAAHAQRRPVRLLAAGRDQRRRRAACSAGARVSSALRRRARSRSSSGGCCGRATRSWSSRRTSCRCFGAGESTRRAPP